MLKKITRSRGNSAISLMSGIAGVFVGALLVLSILYYSGALNHKATDISSAQTTVEQRDDSKNTDTEDKEKAKDSTIKYNSSPSPMPVGSTPLL